MELSITKGNEQAVLTLPKGTLEDPGKPKGSVGSDYQPSDDVVLRAARIIVEHGDTTAFSVQAAIVHHARTNYGFDR